jgi:hypothetical protein
MTMDELTISQSTIKVWDRCKRKWWLEQYRRLHLPRDYRSPLMIGTLVHDALEQYYEGAYGEGSPEFLDPIEWVKRQAISAMEKEPDFAEQIARDSELAGIMVDGYMMWLEETGADADFETVEPERQMRVELKPGIVLLGKLDGKVRTRDGWTGFLETKTVGNFTDLPSYAQIDRQLLTYDLQEYLELLETGTELAPKKPLTDGAILNMLRKVKRTASAKPPFYMRYPVKHNIYELRNHWRHVVGIAAEMQRAIARLEAGETHHAVVPPTPSSDCRWSCSFHAVCPMFDDGSDVEAVLEFEYEEHDPFARYGEEEE